MTEIEIKSYVVDKIEKALLKVEQESPKFDFKARWYNLTEEKELFQFLKHVTAIANTSITDGFIVFGFDDKKENNHFSSVNFVEDSGLKDTSLLRDQIIKYVEPAFNINYYEIFYKDCEDKNIGILHIPPSTNRPFVLPKFWTFDKKKNRTLTKHKIFTRETTSSVEVSREALDRMYFERGFNIKKQEFDFTHEVVEDYFLLKNNGDPYLKLSFLLENTGSKAFVLVNCFTRFSILLSQSSFELRGILTTKRGDDPNLKMERIILNPGEIKELNIYTRLITSFQKPENVFEHLKQPFKAILTLIFNKERSESFSLPLKFEDVLQLRNSNIRRFITPDYGFR